MICLHAVSSNCGQAGSQYYVTISEMTNGLLYHCTHSEILETCSSLLLFQTVASYRIPSLSVRSNLDARTRLTKELSKLAAADSNGEPCSELLHFGSFTSLNLTVQDGLCTHSSSVLHKACHLVAVHAACSSTEESVWRCGAPHHFQCSCSISGVPL